MVVAEPRRRAPAVRTEQILSAAEAVMLRNGVSRATMADVADAAGVGKGTVYLYFESKQALLAGLGERYVGRIENVIRDAVARAESAPDKLGAAVRSFVIESTRRPELHHLLFQEAGLDESVAFAPIRAVFAEVITGSDFRLANPGLAVDYVLGGVHAALISVVHSSRANKNRVISQIEELVRCTLGGAIVPGGG